MSGKVHPPLESHARAQPRCAIKAPFRFRCKVQTTVQAPTARLPILLHNPVLLQQQLTDTFVLQEEEEVHISRPSMQAEEAVEAMVLAINPNRLHNRSALAQHLPGHNCHKP
jgi:hypothetical protein